VTAALNVFVGAEQRSRRAPAKRNTRQVKDFVEFLLSRKRPAKGAGLKQDWAGALKEYRDKYTSLSLQAKVSEWRGD